MQCKQKKRGLNNNDVITSIYNRNLTSYRIDLNKGSLDERYNDKVIVRLCIYISKMNGRNSV